MENKKVNWAKVVLWLMVVLIIIFLIVAFVSDKNEEKLKLEEYKRKLEKDEAEILMLQERNEKIFKRAYGSLKIIFLLFIIGIIWLVIHFTPSNSFFEYISNCTTVFGGIGGIILIACLLLEQNPLDIFKARSFFRNFIFDLIHEPHKAVVNKLPNIRDEIDLTDAKIAELNEEIKRIDVLGINRNE